MMTPFKLLSTLEKRHAGIRSWTAIARQEGSGLIEVAVVLPVFCLLLFGIFAFSMAMVSYLSATYWLREAARYAGMHSLTSISPASPAYLSNLVTSNIFLPGGTTPTVTVNYVYYVGAANGNYVGNGVELILSWTQNINVPLFSTTLPLQSLTYRFITE